MMYRLIKSKKGSALILVTMVFMVLFILGLALLQISMADTRQTTWQNNRIQAHYLGRSGVQNGIKMIESRLGSGFNGTVGQLVNVLQASITNPFTISNVGTYTIQFSEGTYSGEIKITSVGTTIGYLPSTQTVTYTKELGTSHVYTNPAGEWMTGINLDKGINPSNTGQSYLGRAVMLESKNSKNAIQSPKGSSNPSTFRASIVALRDYQGRSLRQITNSIGLTFDAEIILFLGDIKLNSTGEPVLLTVSNEVLKQKTYEYNSSFPNPSGSPGRSPIQLDYGAFATPPNIYAVGFENLERYRAFIKNPSYVPTYSSSFLSGNKYGVVKLGGGIKDNNDATIFNVTDKGYYYFRSGFNLRDAHSINPSTGSSDLIKIPDSDPIVAVLDGLIGMNMGTGTPLWNNH